MAFVFENLPQRGGISGPPSDPRHAAAASVALTVLASDVGSVVGTQKDAFLRSITFFKEEPGLEWDVHLIDPPANSKKNNKKLVLDNVQGCISLSSIRPGDFLKSINGKRIGPSYNAARATQLMHQCLQDDGLLSLSVGNEEGQDIYVEATVLKPTPGTTYEQLGMVVWKWGCLVIKSIEKESLFKHSVLRSSDEIRSINDILCEDMSPESFSRVVNELDCEIKIVVRRGKQRWTGKFG